MHDVATNVIQLLKGGKRIHGQTYIHISLLAEQTDEVKHLVSSARRRAGLDPEAFNVVRFSGVSREIGLLDYSRFFEDPFPALAVAYLVDMATKRVRRTDFSLRENPPILHRKELLLPSEHPDRQKFVALTAALEARNLFSDSQRIGFRKFWDERLSSQGIRIVDHAVVGSSVNDAPIHKSGDVARHKTAIARDRLSAPMQALARHGLLIPERSVLDYGCGFGDDVRALQAGGIPVTGWDPHYVPDVPLGPADIVNLGFVLNVIEDPSERLQAARRAFGLARQCLAVAVMVVGKGDINGLQAYRDGYLTQRKTFQKYYRQEEIKSFLDGALEMEAIPVAPGIFFIFRDKVLERSARRKLNSSNIR
jgi:hypothetical protein